MRRVGLILVVIVVIGGAAFGAFRYGYQQGETSGQATASSDRTAFFGTRGALPAGGAASPGGRPGQGGTGGSPGARGGAGGAETTPGAGGRNGNMTPGAGGSPGAGRPSGQNGVAGRVTGVNGQSLSVQNAGDNTTITVMTSGMTVFTKIVAGTTSDLKMNDFVAVQGDKTGDNAYTARTITGTNAQSLVGAAAGGFPGAPSGTPVAMGTVAASGAGGAVRNGAGSGNGGQVVGRVASMTGDTVVLNALDGSMITVMTTPMTKVQTTQSAALSDIKSGDSLVVIGDRSGDGVTARLVTDQGQG